MKINFIGNICNNNYLLAKELRCQGVDAHLYLPDGNWQTLPESEDPELKGNYPNWIHFLDKGSRFSRIGFLSTNDQKAIANCDLIHTLGHFSYNLPRGVPFVIHPFGTDFYIWPIRSMRSEKLFGLATSPKYWFLKKRLQIGYEKTAAIIMGGYDVHWKLGYEVLLTNKRIAPISIAMNLARFSYGYKTSEAFQKLYPEYDFFVFQTGRQMWTRETEAREGSKGNDRLIRGFSKLVQQRPRSLLVMIDKKDENDTEASKRLIAELGIEKNVRWMDAMPRAELVDYLHSCDIFVDCLNAGGFGSAAAEAMSCGAPTLMKIEDQKYRNILNEVPPMINASTTDEVADKLLHYYDHRAELEEISLLQKRFVERHHDLRVVGKQLIDLYEDILYRKNQFPYIGKEAFITS